MLVVSEKGTGPPVSVTVPLSFRVIVRDRKTIERRRDRIADRDDSRIGVAVRVRRRAQPRPAAAADRLRDRGVIAGLLAVVVADGRVDVPVGGERVRAGLLEIT